MPAASNTSPISNLAIIGRLALLREQFGIVFIPPAVQTELAALPVVTARENIECALRDQWIEVVPLQSPVPVNLAATLDPGEAAAIALTLQLKASMILLDESAARRSASDLGLPHVGVLGVLRHARQMGRIASLKSEIIKLRTQARFFVGNGLEKILLASVGE